ncbi:MAG TPA: phosphoribosylaminoimidazolesuccinocarboxamide synthase [Planktothrix sp.]|jgi:phosphoribosylaminoimidazole-succinocarboxamide synthase
MQYTHGSDPATQPLQLVYEGSVKRVWQSPAKTDRLWFEFTDDYSVFDWGKMPDQIANKGRALAVIGAYIFDRLSKAELWRTLPDSPHLAKFNRAWLNELFSQAVFSGPQGLVHVGLPNHFRSLTHREGRISDLIGAVRSPEPLFMEVLAARVDRPRLQNIFNHTLYLYNEGQAQTAMEPAARRLIPLEIVFRFGMPQGSSLAERLKNDPSYEQELGVKVPPNGGWFAHPVLEFYTKLEPKDRLLSWQEAANMSCLSGVQFASLVELALDTALALHVLFADKGIELWDGKFEMVADSGRLLIADSVGPDELRLLHKGCHLSKELIRQMYRGTPWEKGLKDAQRLAQMDNTRTWKQIATEQLRIAPEPLLSTFKAIVDKLYGVLANHLLGGEIFADHPGLDAFVRSLPDLLLSEARAHTAGEGR